MWKSQGKQDILGPKVIWKNVTEGSIFPDFTALIFGFLIVSGFQNWSHFLWDPQENLFFNLESCVTSYQRKASFDKNRNLYFLSSYLLSFFFILNVSHLAMILTTYFSKLKRSKIILDYFVNHIRTIKLTSTITNTKFKATEKNFEELFSGNDRDDCFTSVLLEESYDITQQSKIKKEIFLGIL